MRAERACYTCLLQQVKSLCDNPQIHATRAFSKEELLDEVGALLGIAHSGEHSNNRARDDVACLDDKARGKALGAQDSKHAKSPSARDMSAVESQDSTLESQSRLTSQSCSALKSSPPLESAPDSTDSQNLESTPKSTQAESIKQDSKNLKSTPKPAQSTSLDSKAQDSITFNAPPPAIAISVYERVARALGSEDPFSHIKAYSNKRAKALRDSLLHTKPSQDSQNAPKPTPTNIHATPQSTTFESTTPASPQNAPATRAHATAPASSLESTPATHTSAPTSPHKTPTALKSTTPTHTSESHTDSIPYPTRLLEWAIKLALLGNVIDYGSQSSFSFENADFSLETLTFGEYALPPLQAQLQGARTLLYLADNAGEHYFDEVLLSALKELYPALHITYGVRGRAIINDLTLKDLSPQARQSLESYCTLLDTGVKSPGFLYEGASEQARACFDEADIILAKGMGNFECLESCLDSRLFMLFKIKCDVVARFCNQPKGVMMLRHNAPAHAITHTPLKESKC